LFDRYIDRSRYRGKIRSITI